MSEHFYKNIRIDFLEKRVRGGKWLDEVMLTATAAGAVYSQQHQIKAFETREEALESGLRKARTFIDAHTR
jgi:hypothetical protein